MSGRDDLGLGGVPEPAPDPAARRAALVRTLSSAVAELVTFELTVSTDLRRFSRAARVIEMASDIEKAYATRVSEVVVDGFRPPGPDEPGALDFPAEGLRDDVATRDRLDDRDRLLPGGVALGPPMVRARVRPRVGAPYYDGGLPLPLVGQPIMRNDVAALTQAVEDSDAAAAQRTDQITDSTTRMLGMFTQAMGKLRGTDEATVLATRLRELGRARTAVEIAGADVRSIDREINDTLAELATHRIPDADAPETEGDRP